MSKQSEQILEQQLIENLIKLGYSNIFIPDESALIAHLKQQLLTRRGNNEYIETHKPLYFNALTIYSLSVGCRRVNRKA